MYSKIKIAFKRLRKRLLISSLLKDLLWPYESCMDCGCCYRLDWLATDPVWLKVVGSDTGCLCIGCFHNRAKDRGIVLKENDFVRFEPFIPKD